MVTAQIEPRQAWTRATLSPRDWMVPVPGGCVDELDAVLGKLRVSPAPLALLKPIDFELPASTALMARVREQLAHGTGLAVLDRFPVERYAPEENRAVAW